MEAEEEEEEEEEVEEEDETGRVGGRNEINVSWVEAEK